MYRVPTYRTYVPIDSKADMVMRSNNGENTNRQDEVDKYGRWVPGTGTQKQTGLNGQAGKETGWSWQVLYRNQTGYDEDKQASRKNEVPYYLYRQASWQAGNE